MGSPASAVFLLMNPWRFFTLPPGVFLCAGYSISSMAIFRREHLTQEGFTGKCYICGKFPAAFKAGLNVLEICLTCAMEKLPALIVDATQGDDPSMKTANLILVHLEKKYWEAVANRFERSKGKEETPPIS